MPEISITDDLGKPVEPVKIDPTQPSSLVNYARSQALHLIVVPAFVVLEGKGLQRSSRQECRPSAGRPIEDPPPHAPRGC